TLLDNAMSQSQFNHWKPNDKGYLSTIFATVVFKCVLQGVLLAAAYRYYSLLPRTHDSRKIQALVAILVILEM
ncbi:7888_t:CDS:1, partial [Acaulospora colombiana]